MQKKLTFFLLTSLPGVGTTAKSLSASSPFTVSISIELDPILEGPALHGVENRLLSPVALVVNFRIGFVKVLGGESKQTNDIELVAPCSGDAERFLDLDLGRFFLLSKLASNNKFFRVVEGVRIPDPGP